MIGPFRRNPSTAVCATSTCHITSYCNVMTSSTLMHRTLILKRKKITLCLFNVRIILLTPITWKVHVLAFLQISFSCPGRDSKGKQGGKFSYTFLTSGKPVTGGCVINPRNGTIQTFFRLECKNFTDDEKPLQYSLFYLSLSGQGLYNPESSH